MRFNAALRKYTGLDLWFGLSVALVTPILALYIKSHGFEDWQVSLLLVIFPFANLFLMPVLGELADRIEKEKLIWTGVGFEILAMLFYIVFRFWAVIILARLIEAIASVLVPLLLLAKIEDSVNDKHRGSRTGTSFSVIYVGTMAGTLLGPWLADLGNIELPFYISILSLMVMFGWLTWGGNYQWSRVDLNVDWGCWWREIKLFWGYEKLKGMGILGMLMHGGIPVMKVFFPLYIVSQLGVSYQSVGVAMMFAGAGHLAQGWFGKLGDRVGHGKLVLSGVLISGIGMALIPLMPSYWWLVGLLFIRGWALAVWNVSAWSLMSQIGEREKIESQVVNSYFSIAKVGSLVTYLVGAIVIKYWGLEWMFVVNGLVVLIGSLAALRYIRR